MTEAEWQASEQPRSMLNFLRGKASARKLRLFACACCRRIWHLLDEAQRRGVVVAERFADGFAAPRERKLAKRPIYGATPGGYWSVEGKVKAAVCAALDRSADAAALGAAQSAWGAAYQAEQAHGEPVAQAHLLRCIAGNPYRPAAVDPGWLTPTVAALAGAAYEERLLPAGELDAVRLGVLADALEEAGAVGSLVDHLRGGSPHVRGCFAVDLLLPVPRDKAGA
jgi:hypothetical protein